MCVRVCVHERTGLKSSVSGAWFIAGRGGSNTFLCVSAGQMASSAAGKLCDLGQMVLTSFCTAQFSQLEK